MSVALWSGDNVTAQRPTPSSTAAADDIAPHGHSRARLLCVDDDPVVLSVTSRLLQPDFDVTTAERGADAVALLEAGETFAVILSDLRMPGMDGIAVLRRARELAPDTVRVLLTGVGDMDAAISGINDAGIFRFLTKPCARLDFVSALNEAVARHQVISSERALLEQTLHGCIRALTDALALAHPAAFGRASRLKVQVSALAAWLHLPDRWEVEVAAMVSQLGMISLPAATADKLLAGRPLDNVEAEAVARVPSMTDQLLANVPRLEGVREMLRLQSWRWDGLYGCDHLETNIRTGAALLRIVLDCDVLESEGHTAATALEMMRGRRGVYDAGMLDNYGRVRGVEEAENEIREMPLQAVLPGMRLMDDVRTRGGLLLIPKGFEMNSALHARLSSYDAVLLKEPVRVVVNRRPAAA